MLTWNATGTEQRSVPGTDRQKHSWRVGGQKWGLQGPLDT